MVSTVCLQITLAYCLKFVRITSSNLTIRLITGHIDRQQKFARHYQF